MLTQVRPTPGFLNWGPRCLLGATKRFSGRHDQRALLNGSAVISQNPIDEQGVTSVESFWKGGTNSERWRNTGLNLRTQRWKRIKRYILIRTHCKPGSCVSFIIKVWKQMLWKDELLKVSPHHKLFSQYCHF